MELSDNWQLMKSGEKVSKLSVPNYWLDTPQSDYLVLTLHGLSVQGVPTLKEYLANLPSGSTVAMDAALHSAQVSILS